jgi:hypothetical protein
MHHAPEVEVPADADFIIEGYVDPNDEMIWEGHLVIIQVTIHCLIGIHVFISRLSLTKKTRLPCHYRGYSTAGRCMAGKSN